jgi:hypothetical protein
MKKLCHFYLSVLVLLVIVGCASTPVKFNEIYLPNAIPNKPNERVTFQSDVNKAIAQYLRKPDFSNNIELCWLAADNLYLNLEGSGVYVINPGTKDIRKLISNEEKDILQKISQKVNIANTAKKAGLIKKVSSYLFSYLGQEYEGEIIDNNNKLQVYIQTNEKRSDDVYRVPCESAKLMGKLTNNKGNELDIQWDYNCEWLPQAIADYKVPQLLKKLNISPSGKYYLCGSILYSADKNGIKVDLMPQYPNVISISVNPEWSKIAVLRGKGGKYWIEFFDIRIES